MTLLTKALNDPFQKAKVQLVLNHPFFGVLVMHLPTIPVSASTLLSAGVNPPTAAVDGDHIYYFDEWVKTLTEKQRMGLLAHEVMHPAMHHLWRRGSRDRKTWMRATDYVVNSILVKSGMELPPGGLYDDRFEGMSAEQVYAILFEEKQQQQKGKKGKKQKQQGGGDDGDDGDDGEECALDGQLETKLRPKKSKPKNDDKEKEEQEEKAKGSGKPKSEKDEEPEEDEGDGKADKKPKKEKKPKATAGDEGEEDDENEADSGESGDGDESDADEGDEPDGDDGEGEGEDGGDGGDGKAPGSKPGTNPKDNSNAPPTPEQQEGTGDGEDHSDVKPLDEKEISENEEEKWSALLNQAAMVAKARGNLPGELARLVEDMTESKVPWQQIIERFVNEIMRDDYDMMKQDRRFMQSGIYFPELQSDSTYVSVIMDTSGSIGGAELRAFAGEIRGILNARGVGRLRLMTCDTEVHLDEMLTPHDPMPDNFPGGGGTDFREPFRLIERDMTDKPALIVYITDMEGTFPNRDIGIPTIWLAACPPYLKHEQFDARYKVPFGTIIRYDPILEAETAGGAFE